MLEELKKKVIEIALKSKEDKLVPLTMGNFSMRDKKTGYICITPSGMDYHLLAPSDIVVVDEDCNIIEGQRKPSIETPMHCITYKKRKDVYGIVHTHSTYATAWASCGEEIPVVVAELAGLIGGPVKCAPYKPMGTIELAHTAVEFLKDMDGILLANHGVLAVGPDIDIAYKNAVIIEEGAKIAYFAKEIGTMKVIPQDECISLRKATILKYGQNNH